MTETTAPTFPKITALTCAAAVGFTALFHAGGDPRAMVMSEEAIGREPWRIVSSTLTHGGILHLLFNLSWTWKLGGELERRMSSWAWLGFLGLVSSTSMAAQFALSSGGIGLSGVVYGLAGYIWIRGKREQEYRELMDQGTLRLLVGWFFFCILLTEFDLYPVANIAHGVGALMGVALAWAGSGGSSQTHARDAEPFSSTASATGPPSSGNRQFRPVRLLAVATLSIACLASPRLTPQAWLSTSKLFQRYGQRINASTENGNPVEIIELAQQALLIDATNTSDWPGSAYFLYVSAFYKHKLGRDREATAEAKRAKSMDPDLPGPDDVLIITLYNIALEEISLGGLEEALAHLREVLEIQPNDRKTWEVLVGLHEEMGNLELSQKAQEQLNRLR